MIWPGRQRWQEDCDRKRRLWCRRSGRWHSPPPPPPRMTPVPGSGDGKAKRNIVCFLAVLSPQILGFPWRWVWVIVLEFSTLPIPSMPVVSERTIYHPQPAPAGRQGRTVSTALPGTLPVGAQPSSQARLVTLPSPCAWDEPSLHIHLECQPCSASLGCFQT